MKSNIRLSNGQRLNSPPGLKTRPTTSIVREALMSILGEKIKGSNFLDLCSGSGSISCEALYRGSKNVVAVEKNHKAALVCRSNLLEINKKIAQNVHFLVVCKEVIGLLKQGSNSLKSIGSKSIESISFDLIYIDPPYGLDLYFPILEGLLQGNWLKKNSIVVCEHAKEKHLKANSKWLEIDRRTYGKSSLLLITPQPNHFDGIDSKHQQTIPKGL